MAIKTINYNDGNTYVGETNNQNQPHGKGKMTYAPNNNWNILYYDGDWVNGHKTGYGVMEWKTGQKYEGEWKDDARHGKGKETFAPNDCYNRVYYDGDRVNSYKTGYGVMEWKTGQKYEGGWKDNSRHGQGKQIYANGDVYVGEWKDDRRGGYGVIVYANGTAEAGEWEDDKLVSSQHEFVNKDKYNKDLTLANDEKNKAQNEANELAKKVATLEAELKKKPTNTGDSTKKAAPPMQDTYEGENNHRGEPHGMGTMKYASGETYSGGWAHGDWFGFGSYTTPDGVQYIGSFADYKMSQNLVRISQDGIPAKGTMNNGLFIETRK